MRVKRGTTSHKRHHKIRKATKGFSHPNRVSIKRGRQTLIKSLQFATRDRKNKKRSLRELWNTRINAAARLNDTTYSKLIFSLKQNNIELDRKVLAELAVSEPKVFTKLVKTVVK
jgi:LSU ribosomal protein L20P